MKTALELVAAAKACIREVSIDEAEQAASQADVLIDVREPDEYRQGHLPGAVNMPRGLLEFQLSSNPACQSPDLDVVLYCKTSGRAALAARTMQDMGLHVVSCGKQHCHWGIAGANGLAGRCLSLDMRR
ncbi:rhodanese-like domain-containing protein [Melaminivora alkalimesophila]|uniref:rhodanese-like domain-containing protein n=1 Tax=Melaminivora alkalimesophila TaxID=1165852 RepID=UPI0009D9E799|nr:rhodanese-like domain-containing protein [Melaminivora alkalimesophila]